MLAFIAAQAAKSRERLHASNLDPAAKISDTACRRDRLHCPLRRRVPA
jgi:hypothetical protein